MRTWAVVPCSSSGCPSRARPTSLPSLRNTPQSTRRLLAARQRSLKLPQLVPRSQMQYTRDHVRTPEARCQPHTSHKGCDPAEWQVDGHDRVCQRQAAQHGAPGSPTLDDPARLIVPYTENDGITCMARQISDVEDRQIERPAKL